MKIPVDQIWLYLNDVRFRRIQISEETFFALEKIGGYIAELRGEIDIKGERKMVTYWLRGKTFHVSHRSMPVEEEAPLMFPQLKPTGKEKVDGIQQGSNTKSSTFVEGPFKINNKRGT